MKEYESIQIYAINGSSRKDGKTADVLSVILKDARHLGAQKAEMIHLRDEKLDPCDGLKEPPLADDFKSVYKRLKEADGIIFGTPTYWFTMSGLMKNFIDRLTVTEHNGKGPHPKAEDTYMLEGKVAGFVATGDHEEDGAMAALSGIAAAVNHLGMATFPYSMLYFRGNGSSWAKKDHRCYAKWMLDMVRVMRKYKCD